MPQRGPSTPSRNDGGTAVEAVLHEKSGNDDASTKLQQQPVLKLEFAIKKIKANVDYARDGYRSKMYVAYAECCALAYRMKQNSSEWRKFCNFPFWKQLGKAKPELIIGNALYLVLVYAVYGPSRSQKKTASKVSIALKAYTDGVHETQNIVDIIQEKGGIAKLARKNAAPKPAKQPKTSEDGPAPARKLKVGLVGSPLADVLKHKLNTKFHIEAMMVEDADGKKVLKCLSVDKIA